MSVEMRKLAILAGGGDLPVNVAHAAGAKNIDYTVIGLKDFYDQEDRLKANIEFRIGDVGAILKYLKKQKVDSVCFAGYVHRPNLKAMRLDMGGMKYLPGAIKAAAKGDDALLRYVGGIFEQNGMTLIGPQEISNDDIIEAGVLGEYSADKSVLADIEKARLIALSIGELDIGQGAIVCDGVVLAVEAQEGTDAMLKRVADLPKAIRGTTTNRRGALVKMLKPGQETRIDLPTIGLETVMGADKAGLAAIAMVEGEGFILNRKELIETANEAGIAIIGLETRK